MDINDFRSIVTLFSLLLFLALMAWTFWPTRREDLAEAAQLVFEGEVPPAGEGTGHE